MAVGELAGEALAAAGTFVGDMHRGIAGRPFGVLGRAAAPVRVIHDGISSCRARQGAAPGRGRRIPFEVDHGHELAGLSHFDLLNHPAVYAQLRARLAQPAAGATTAATPASPRAFG